MAAFSASISRSLRLTAASLCWHTAPAFATAAPAAAIGFSELAQVAGALGLVLALIFVLALAAQRFKRLQGAGGKHMRIIDGITLGTRDRLLLVEVGEQRLLLGLCAGRIERLHVFPAGSTGFAAALTEAAHQTDQGGSP